MKMLRMLFWLLVFGMAINAASAQTGEKGVLKIGTSQEFENMNPLIKQMSATNMIYEMVGRTLVVLDVKGNWIPQLAKEIPTLENRLAEVYMDKNVKKLKAQWEIKEEAKWGDGKPVTGEDVKFSWMVARDENISVGEKEIYNQVERVEVDPKNPKKFTFFYAKAKWDFNQLGTFNIIPKHLEEGVFKKFAKEKEGYSKNSKYTTDPKNPGLYNGPYRIEEIKLGSHVVLVTNSHFYGQKPSIPKIIIKLIPNTATLESNLRSGNIDMISTLGLSLDQAIAFEKKIQKENLPFEVKYKQGMIYEHIDLNLNNPILKDERVRKALVFGVNRQQLTEALFEGKQKPAIHNFTPLDPWYTDDAKKVVLYPYSVRKAKALLEEAGWKTGSDGYRYKDGQKLSFQLMTTSGNKLRELVEVYLQNEWKKIGVEVTIKNEPPRVFFGETVRKGEYPALAMFAWVSAPTSNPRSTLHSKSIPTKDNGFSGQNSGGYASPKMDQLIEQLDEEFDAEKRKELAAQILFHYTQDVPVIPLYYRSEIAVTPKGLKGHELTGHQFSESNHVENWNFENPIF